MPEQPPDPLVTSSFLLALQACTWADNHLLNSAGGIEHPAVSGSNPGTWVLSATTGVLISQANFNILYNAVANADGSFTSGGVSFWLSVQNIDGHNWAVPVAK